LLKIFGYRTIISMSSRKHNRKREKEEEKEEKGARKV
jgi:hypothetical protein